MRYQGIARQSLVRHHEGDFNFRYFLSYAFPDATSVFLYLRIFDPGASRLICAKVVQKVEENSFFSYGVLILFLFLHLLFHQIAEEHFF